MSHPQISQVLRQIKVFKKFNSLCSHYCPSLSVSDNFRVTVRSKVEQGKIIVYPVKRIYSSLLHLIRGEQSVILWVIPTTKFSKIILV